MFLKWTAVNRTALMGPWNKVQRANLPEPYSEPLQSCRLMALFGQQEWSLSLKREQSTVSAKDWLLLAHFLLTWHSDFSVHTLLFSFSSEGTSSGHSVPPSIAVNAHFLPRFLWHQRRQTLISFFFWRGLTSEIQPDLERESSVVKGARLVSWVFLWRWIRGCPPSPAAVARCPASRSLSCPLVPDGASLLCLLLPLSSPGLCAGTTLLYQKHQEHRGRAQGAQLWTPEGCCEPRPRSLHPWPFKNQNGRGPGQLLQQGDWTRWSEKITSNLNDSVFPGLKRGWIYQRLLKIISIIPFDWKKSISSICMYVFRCFWLVVHACIFLRHAF